MKSLAFLLLFLCQSLSTAQEPPTCSAVEGERDPNLREMTYDVGDGEKSAWVYVDPDISSYYRMESPAQTKVTPKHNGFSGKFINMSAKPATLHWEERAGGTKHPMRHHGAFSASGTATFPGHRFVFTPHDDPDTILHTMVVGEYPENIYVYNPYYVEDDPEQTEANLAALTPEEREKYEYWRRTLEYNEQYKAFTGRSYLANYLRKPPTHFMWRADYFGQEHWVTTRETHFTQEPPSKQMQKISLDKRSRILKEPMLLDYREPGMLNMTLKVLACSPRAFEIENFLSPMEVQHVMQLASGIDLSLSSTGDSTHKEKKVAESTRRTRTSFNSWIPREESPIVDAIYRRASDLLRIDESLMRYRNSGEHPHLKTKKSIAESLQLVHYEDRQEYTAHHDFGFSRIEDEDQGARFVTILLYLNEGMEGGETSFPRWVNAESFKPLDVTPVAGKAVLFYSQLPDGNLDDFSHHAANPVTAGEKWLTNLWVWDPTYE